MNGAMSGAFSGVLLKRTKNSHTGHMVWYESKNIIKSFGD
jgi:hypothetical protein